MQIVVVLPCVRSPGFYTGLLLTYSLTEGVTQYQLTRVIYITRFLEVARKSRLKSEGMTPSMTILDPPCQFRVVAL